MINILIVIFYHRFRNPFHPLIIANNIFTVFKNLKTVIRLIDTDKQKYNITILSLLNILHYKFTEALSAPVRCRY